jgi:hypothetical protein
MPFPSRQPLPHRAADLLKRRDVPPAVAAAVLAREPRSPLTQAVKLWGDDEEPFKNLVSSAAPDARAWRRTMERFLRHLAPDLTGRSVYRGWYFPSRVARTGFLESILEERFFESLRIGMSASRSLRTATSLSFVNPFGMVWEIQKPKTGRDVSEIFRTIGAKYPEQREVIFPKGSRFALAERPRRLSLVRGGQKIAVPYVVFEEI